MQRRHTWALGAGVAATAALHIWSLLRFPPPFVDEAWHMSRAWSFLQTGKTFGMLDSGVPDKNPGYWTFLPWFGNMLQATALRFSGAPSLLAVRVVSLLFGALLLLAVFIIARRLGGPMAAWVSIALTAYSAPFWQSAHQARYDIMVAAIGFSAIALYCIDLEWPRWWLRVLCGLMLGLAVELHAFAAIFVLPLAALYLLRYRWRILRQPAVWQVIAGGTAGLIFYLAMHVLPYPQTFLALNKIYFGQTHVPPLLSGSPGAMLRALIDTGAAIVQFGPRLIPVIGMMLIWMIWHATPDTRRWLAMAGALLLAFSLLLHNKFSYYNIYISPLFDIGLGMFIAWLWHQPLPQVTPLARRLILGCVVGLCLFSVTLQLRILRINYYPLYQRLQTRINSVVQPNDVVLGAQTYWLGLNTHTYYSWEQLVYYRRQYPGATIEQAMRSLKPDIFILDEHIANFILDGSSDIEFTQAFILPRAEMQAFLARYGVLVAEIDGDIYGPVQIFRLNWTK
jgi:4-amino-4-deoxy-L-arabinose transferase-like glycosyltransferase